MHQHCHGPANYDRAFAIGISLNLAYIFLEAGAGFYNGSLALLADAGHNLSDVLGLLLAWGAYVLAKLRPTNRRTYGWRGSSILAAMLNGLILLVVTGGIGWEAIQRFASPHEVSGPIVIGVAAIGVVINALTAMLFFRGGKHDLNIRGAYLHMAADAAVSLAVVVSGIAIHFWGLSWIDPAMSLLVAGVILLSTWGLFRESVDLLLHAVPKHIDIVRVKRCLEGLPDVVEVHDLHVWAMSTTEPALTAHLVRPIVENEDQFLADAATSSARRVRHRARNVAD